MLIDILNQFKLHPFISDKASIETYSSPFPHIVIKNLLKDSIYESLSSNFKKYIDSTTKFGRIGNTDKTYDAKIYCMKEQDCKDGYEFFASPFWKDFVSYLFSIQFNQHLAYSLHYHEPNTVDGHSHRDLGICSAIPDYSKKVKLTGDCLYADDSKYKQPHTDKIIRSVAGLYYFNNDTDGSDEMGGGTAIYKNYEAELEKIIPPINNSFFMFKIGVKSFHGFKKSKFYRSAMVQWFHSDLKYFIEKNSSEFEKCGQSIHESFERWIPDEELCDLP